MRSFHLFVIVILWHCIGKKFLSLLSVDFDSSAFLCQFIKHVS
uniref:Uncharacterized protein n=1 Tax=Rhizophora mucronata TaxID=61149 RepID=A0A2P2N0H5_RHIMU